MLPDVLLWSELVARTGGRRAAAAAVQAGTYDRVLRGAYVLADAPGGDPQIVLMASGSEVEIILKAQDALAAEGIRTRTVSMASMELFAQQDEAYRNSVLPPGIRRVSIEASQPMSWYKWVGTDGVAGFSGSTGASASTCCMHAFSWL